MVALLLVIPLLLGEALSTSPSTRPATVATSSEKRPRLFKQDDKYGFKDITGAVVIEATYADAQRFSEGLAAVNIGGKKVPFRPFIHGGKWGYIDSKGTLVIPASFDSAGPFCEGLALVTGLGHFRYIDRSGRTAIEVPEGTPSAGNFGEAVAPLYIDRSRPGHGSLTRYIDKTGRAVFEVEGDGRGFHEGLATIALKKGPDEFSWRVGFIDHQGKTAIEPRFAEARDFSQGLAAVRPTRTPGLPYGMGDSWGYIDKSGNYVLPPQFNQAYGFFNGLARVHVGGEIVKMFDHPPFWKGGEWRLIDKAGQVLKRSQDWIDYSIDED